MTDATPNPAIANEAAPALDDAQRTRCEIWTRVRGYHRPVSSWNPGKQSEHRERRYYAAPTEKR